MKAEANARTEESRALAAVANAEAGKANENAGLANERTRKLEQENIKLRTDLEEATAEARQKATELALAQEKTAIAQKEAAQTLLNAQRQLQQVRSFQTPRRLLSGQNRNEFLRELKRQSAGSLEIIWAADAFIAEPRRFAEDIANAAIEAGWKVPKIEGTFIVEDDKNPFRVKVTAGIRIIVRDVDKVPPSAIALYNAITAAGFIVDFIPNREARDDIVKLLVLMIPPDGGWILRFAK